MDIPFELGGVASGLYMCRVESSGETAMIAFERRFLLLECFLNLVFFEVAPCFRFINHIWRPRHEQRIASQNQGTPEEG